MPDGLEVGGSQDKNNNEPFILWLENLEVNIQELIEKRIYRIKNNNYGDYRRLKNGLIEIKFRSGHRIYCIEKKDKILLLCGGNKHRQQKDIDKALEYIKEIKTGVKNAKEKI